MGVGDVDALVSIAAPQLAPGTDKRTGAGRKLVELHLEPIEPAQRGDLIAHEAPALGVGGVGPHVGDHEGAHVLPKVAPASEYDGPRGQFPGESLRSARATDRRVRLGDGRSDGAARAAGAVAARGLPLPWRYGALSLRRAHTRGTGALLGPDRRGAVATAHEAP